MNNPKATNQQKELVRVLTDIAKRRIKEQVQKMTPEQVDKWWDSLNLNGNEPPQVLRRCYAGCSSRLRAAWWADSYSLGVV